MTVKLLAWKERKPLNPEHLMGWVQLFGIELIAELLPALLGQIPEFVL